MTVIKTTILTASNCNFRFASITTTVALLVLIVLGIASAQGQTFLGDHSVKFESAQTLPYSIVSTHSQAAGHQTVSLACPLCSANSTKTTQSIQLRKNILGCQACYKVLPQDEIWVLSVRDCVCDLANLDRVEVKKLVDNRFQAASLDALKTAHQLDTQKTTVVYVHGNQTNYEYGVARGFQFYNNLFVKHACPRPPLRLVLWVWKSERELPRLYPDYLVKSERAVRMGKTLTETLNQFGNRKLALVGFSLGAQVILSSLEEMTPQCDLAATDDKFHVALIAPATDPDYICKVINRDAKTSIVRMSSVIVNFDDRAVKAMRVVVRRECPEARDRFSKLACENHFPLGPIEFFEVSQEISRKHAIERYTKSPTVKRAMNRVITRVAAETL